MPIPFFKARDGKNYFKTFILVCTLFLLWGFAHSFLDVLNKQFQNSLHITKSQSGLIQTAVYGGYFLMAIPAGLIARRFGYKAGILVGLGLVANGAFWFYPAVHLHQATDLVAWVQKTFSLDPQIAEQWTAFSGFLLGLFTIALGLTCLEAVANPYSTVLGPPETSASRINLAQTANAFGWITAPAVGGLLIFSSTSQVNTSNNALALPYCILGFFVILLALLFYRADLPEIHGEPGVEETSAAAELSPGTALLYRSHYVFAVVSQFFYVAAQTGVNSFFINYIVEDLAGWKDQQASYLLSFGGMTLFMLGRLSGSFLMPRIPPHRLLALYGLINTALMALIMAGEGIYSAFALVACYFFMSIMFPTIFSLGLHGLGGQTKKAASPLVMAIVGGAVAPVLMGWIADHASMRIGFVIPLVCFIVIGVYAFLWPFLLKKGPVTASAR